MGRLIGPKAHLANAAIVMWILGAWAPAVSAAPVPFPVQAVLYDAFSRPELNPDLWTASQPGAAWVRDGALHLTPGRQGSAVRAQTLLGTSHAGVEARLVEASAPTGLELLEAPARPDAAARRSVRLEWRPAESRLAAWQDGELLAETRLDFPPGRMSLVRQGRRFYFGVDNMTIWEMELDAFVGRGRPGLYALPREGAGGAGAAVWREVWLAGTGRQEFIWTAELAGGVDSSASGRDMRLRWRVENITAESQTASARVTAFDAWGRLAYESSASLELAGGEEAAWEEPLRVEHLGWGELELVLEADGEPIDSLRLPYHRLAPPQTEAPSPDPYRALPLRPRAAPYALRFDAAASRIASPEAAPIAGPVLSADAAFDWAPALAEAAPVLRGVGFISGGRPEEAWLEDARLLQRLLRSYGGGLELWDLGWDPLSIGTGMDAARAFLITSARRAAAGVDRSFYRLQGGEAPSPLHAAEAVWRRLVEGRPYAGRLPWEDGVEAYAFGRGSDMVLIAWSDQPGRRPIPHSDGPVIVADMMGNAALAGPGPDGRAWVEIGPDPVYVIGLPAAARLLVDADALEDLRRSALVEPPEALRSEWERFLERAESVELPPGRPWDAGARRIWRRFESQAGAAEEAAWSLALAAARSLGGEGELSGHRAALHAALRWAMALNRLRGDVGEALQLDLPHEEEAAEARRLKEVLAVRLQERSSGPFAVYAETDRVRAMFEEELAALDWRESPAVQAARSRAAEWLGRIAAALAAQERPYFPGLMVEREDRNVYIARGGDEFAVSATVTSGYGLPAEAALELEPPAGWEAEPGRHTFQTGAVETATLEARFRPVSGERLRSGEMKARLLLEGQVVDSWSFVVIP